MNELVLTRGLPASGKTTWAMEWLAGGPKRARSNRDDLRATVFGGHGILPREAEEQITRIQQDKVRGLLAAGWSVVIDDMHLRARYARQWADVAVAAGAELRVVDFPVPLEECIARDGARPRQVGEEVLRDLHARFCGRPWPEITPSNVAAPAWSYVPDETLPPAWLVDVDGTLALMSDRSPFDWHRVGEDSPNEPVVKLTNALASQADVVVMSGRDSACRADTEAWLHRHGIPFKALYMRTEGDQRKDSVVKLELFREHIADRWRVVGTVDDRNQVVEMWRSIGLTCVQVAPGDF